jgi:hypothetical protein
MGKRLALAIGLVLAGLVAAQAQQASGSKPGNGLGTGTPGGSFGKAGATTPGAEDKQAVPGGAIPMGAATQDGSELPKDSASFDNAGSSKKR